MIFGHDWVVKRFEKPTVQALLFYGIPSVGKWTTAEALRELWNVSDSDVLRIYKLNVADAKEAVRFASMAPVSGDTRLIIIRLARGQHQNILLKALEESPETTRFILIPWSMEDVLPAVVSRCLPVLFSPLSVEDLAGVLESRGIKPAQAHVWAERGEGQVKRALAFREVNEARTPVSAVLRAFREKDPLALDTVAGDWTEVHTDLLVTWCNEAVTKRWQVFTEEDAEGLSPGLPMKILVALHTDVRPKFVIRSTLYDLLRSES